MTDVTVEKLAPSEKSLATGLVRSEEVWMVKVDDIIVCVTVSRNAAKAVRKYILDMKLQAKHFSEQGLQYQAVVNEKCVANCAIEDIAMLVQEWWEAPPPPGSDLTS